MNNQNNASLIKRIDYFGLTLIGLISLGYCCFLAIFAELSIQLPFLNFPIFIGEVFLFVCLLLLFFKWKISGQKHTIWGYLVLAYVAFILCKAFTGYFKWGPLALRHSALFYYFLFAALGYSFFRKEYFTGKKAFFLIVLFNIILAADTRFINIVQWDRIACFILAFVLIKQQLKSTRYLLLVILFICTPFSLFFWGQRTMLVSNAAVIFLLLITLPFIIKVKKNVAIGFAIIILMLLYFGVSKISDKNAVRSILNLQDNINEYKKNKAKIIMLEPSFKIHTVKQPHVYNKDAAIIGKQKNKKLTEKPLKEGIRVQPKETLSQAEKPLKEEIRVQPKETLSQEIESLLIEKKVQLQTNSLLDLVSNSIERLIVRRKFEKSIVSLPERSLNKFDERPPDQLYGNSFFRIFIWQDMLMDLKIKKPIFGFDFGKPFRSKKIEILNMAWGEWSRDGWIAAHNSYLEIIYRSGIVGIILILLILIVFIKIVLLSITNKSLLGILLCAILLNWLIAANFMLIFELPYHAIPLWSLFGISLAYVKGFSRK